MRVADDLAAIDEALSSGRVSASIDRDRQLQELALALRAESPVPRGEFAERLDARVREGFPPEAPKRRHRLGRALAGRLAALPLSRPSPALLGGVASVLVGLVVLFSLVSGGAGEDPPTTDGGGSAAPARPQADALAPGGPAGTLHAPGPAGRAQAGGAAERDSLPESSVASPVPPLPPGHGGIAPGQRNRRIERSAMLTLAAPEDELDRIGSEIVAIVDRRRGFVLRSHLTTGEGGTTGGSYELRIPARDLQPALRELSELGSVRARTQQGEDVTTAVVTAEDRLLTALAQRRSLLRRLERAEIDRAAAAIRERLNILLGEIRGLRGELRNLRERTVYAAVTVSLVEASGDDDGGSRGESGPMSDALDDFVGSLEVALAFGLRALGVILPLALLAGAGWIGASIFRRRRREAALS